ncbi:MAG: site-specific integrase [Deltaproteobacteria bacterium]|nr:site-specific integrase [Deltaproteobacteria bacterium]
MSNRFTKDYIDSGQSIKSVLGTHVNTFMSAAADLGYSPSTMRTQLQMVKNLIRWVQENDIVISNIDESIIDRFLLESRRKGAVRRGDKKTLHRFLDHLQREGATPHLKPAANDSPLANIQSRYEYYLLRERGLSAVTGPRYWPYIQRFLLDQFGNKAIRFCELCSQDIDHFILRYAHQGTAKTAQLMVSALRSFFRFLFRYGETKCDLSTAVPTVAAWRLSEVPKYIKPEEVESLLESCDRTTSVGRRNYSILLLIARLGLRAGEIVALELGDINWRVSELTIRGKGQFYDRLPLPQSVGEALAIYLKADRPKCLTRRVFVRMRAPYRGFKDSSTVSTIVRRTVEKSGLITPSKGAHLLRHSFATGMLREGASMTEIGELLRHRSPNSTEIYAKVDIEGLRSIARIWPEKGGAM